MNTKGVCGTVRTVNVQRVLTIPAKSLRGLIIAGTP